MATVISLICWGGKTGKSVTASSVTDLVTLTNHGLRDATGLQFVSGTLPSVAGTALALNTTYYAKYIASNTFELYYDQALTTKIDLTSNGAALVLRSAYYQGLADKSRWTYGGTEYIYDSLTAWKTARAAASAFDQEVCEIGMVWTDIMAGSLILTAPAATGLVTPINGAGHNGVVGAGYSLEMANANTSVAMLRVQNCTIEGVTIYCNGVGSGVAIESPGAVVDRCIIGSTGAGTANFGVKLQGHVSTLSNCLVYGFKYGYRILHQYLQKSLVVNNTFTKNDIGVSSAYTVNVWEIFYNNISVGNTTTDWLTQPSGIVAGGNAGVSPWVTGAYSAITMETTDFVDYANNDYRPALSTSPHVDTAIAFYGIYPHDIADDERPNYNNGGAEAYDIGAYEYDHGYGPHPASTTVTFSGVNASSEIRVYNTALDELAGIETCSANQVLTWAIPTGDVRIVIIHPDYKIKEFTYASVVGTQSLPVQQERDKWYKNPI